MPRIFRTVAAVTAAAAAVTLSACSSDDSGGAPVALAPAAEQQQLGGVCPHDVVVQLQWQPQSDMGALFQMLGPGYRVDSAAHSVTGPLVAGGKDTGVRLTLRAGGPAIGFQSVSSQLYVDNDVTLGIMHGDQVVAAAASQPVVGVTPLLKYSPTILMWDPASHPDWRTITDIGHSHATVVVSKDQIYPQWLVGRGLIDRAQLDTSYDGAPARFVGDPKIAQQGFADAEPYAYQHTVAAWSKPVQFQLVKDMGYDIYASNMVVRADRVDALAPCLQRLVPIIQQSGVDYITAPDAANKTIVDMVAADVTYTPYTADEAADSAKMLVSQGLVANEADGSFGTYDPARTQDSVGQLVPILNAGGAGLPSGLTGDRLFSPRFTDHTIGIH
ncbi:nitrate ABC transporter substrate-binding protein [Nocardia sp. alder85J]|nr:nitrate ABC transporter substrate-binding protein [Nocardia sp. alder85J]MCX4091476.1 nitrate ABC transporter substrate-binding protein [Nocardia sp. alder85J]